LILSFGALMYLNHYIVPFVATEK